MESGLNSQDSGMESDKGFYLALKFTLPHEGGYVFDPSDLGGETKWGISKRAYPDLDIKNLSQEQAASVYYNDYWIKGGAINVSPESLAACHFDSCVNNGIATAAKWLEMANGSWDTYLTFRSKYYYALVAKKPDLNRYKKGWINRILDLRKYCEILDQP